VLQGKPCPPFSITSKKEALRLLTHYVTNTHQPPHVTGKQITFDPNSGRIFWCDREGLRVMSCHTDGSDVIVHVQTGSTAADRQDRRRHPVGVAVDYQGGFLYGSQKGKPKGNEGMILRAPLAVVPQDPTSRTDIEVFTDGLHEPIDLHWDAEESTLYWTDRGDPPRGNTLNRAPASAAARPSIMKSFSPA
jgi:hypothetical protein